MNEDIILSDRDYIVRVNSDSNSGQDTGEVNEQISDAEMDGDSESETSVDYSSILVSIDDNVAECLTSLELVNSNIVVLNDNIKILSGFVFALVFSMLIHWGFKIFNDLFGLGKFN